MKTNLREARKAKGLTQQQLADRTYVTSRSIIALEKGVYNPSLLLGLPPVPGAGGPHGNSVLPGR